MPSHSSIFNFKNCDPLKAILLFAALVVMVETSLSFLPQNSLIQSFRDSRVSPGPTPDVQVMGDSVAQGGIIAEQLAQALPDGKIVHNRAIAATGPEFPYFILQRQIAAGKIPKVLICAPSPHTFASLRIPSLVGAFCDWREIMEVARTGQQPFEIIYGVLCKLSYTLRHREEMADLFKGRKQSAETTTTPTVSAKPIPAKPASHFPKEKIHSMYRKPFSVQKFNAILFEKFLTLAQVHQIKVYWATMPALSVVQESRQQFGFEADYEHFLDKLHYQYGVEFLQKEFLIFNDVEFKDYTHLNQAGAEHFTRMLGGKLAAAENKSVQP